MPAGSGPSGSASVGGTCWIGGADESGQIQALTRRVADLERQIGLLLGGDVQTGQLSYISSQIGWVHGVSFMGSTGWTRTEYGTLIPPPGFSLVGSGLLGSGSGMQAVVGDEDGNYFSLTGGGNYITLFFSDVGSGTLELEVTDFAGIFNENHYLGQDEVTIPANGYYLLSFSSQVGVTAGDAIYAEIRVLDADAVQQHRIINNYTNASGTGQNHGFSVNQPLPLEAGWTVRFIFDIGLTGIVDCHAAITRLG